MSRRAYITVEVDLGEIETYDLKKELELRHQGSEISLGLREIYYALKFGMDERALVLMRTYCCDELGATL